MSAADPPDRETYDRLFAERTRYTGQFSETRCHLPCPFCAAADWSSWTVWPGHPDNVEIACQRDVTCFSCGRGAKAIVTRSGAGSIGMEWVQTRGEDPPAYLPPMRRVGDPAPA